MKAYFENQLIYVEKVDENDVASYRNLVIIEMEKLGASESDKHLLNDATIRNSIRNKRKPEDVAWALIQ